MLQVAAATNCKHHYGVEKADIPAKYAEVSHFGDLAMSLYLFSFSHLFAPIIRWWGWGCGGTWGEGVIQAGALRLCGLQCEFGSLLVCFCSFGNYSLLPPGWGQLVTLSAE